jgi:AcrR family transcriptional regulator
MKQDNETQKKELIAESFRKHFEHFGFQKTSVDNISNELKISKKTIYKFFDTKEKIFYYIISKVADDYCRKMEKDVQKQSFENNTEKISYLVSQIFTEANKWLKKGNDAFEFKYKFEIAEMAFKDAYNKLFEKIITDGVQSGEFKTGNVQFTMRFINGIFSEAMRLLSVNPEVEIETETNKTLIKLLQ